MFILGDSYFRVDAKFFCFTLLPLFLAKVASGFIVGAGLNDLVVGGLVFSVSCGISQVACFFSGLAFTTGYCSDCFHWS